MQKFFFIWWKYFHSYIGILSPEEACILEYPPQKLRLRIASSSKITKILKKIEAQKLCVVVTNHNTEFP